MGKRKRNSTANEHHTTTSETSNASNRKRPPSAFILYSNQQYKERREANMPNDKEAIKEIGRAWRALPLDERKKFKDMATTSINDYTNDKSVLPPKPRPSRMQTRISLKSIVHVMTRLNETQRNVVRDIGFGGLLGIRCTRLDHELCEWLVDKFDPTTCSLHVHGRQLILIATDINVLMGIRSEGQDVQLEGSLQSYPNIYAEVGLQNGVIPLNDLKLYLTDTDGAGDEFSRKFALYVLGALLCATTRPAVTPSFVHAVKDVNGMCASNWAKLTLDFLVQGVQKFKLKGYREPSGCIFLVMLFYLDSVSLTPESNSATARSTPCLIDWGDDEMKAAMRHFRLKGGTQNEEFKFKVTKVESHVYEEKTDAPLQEQRRTDHIEDRLIKVKTDISEVKDMMRQMLQVNKRLERFFVGQSPVHVVRPHDVPSVSYASDVEVLTHDVKLGCVPDNCCPVAPMKTTSKDPRKVDEYDGGVGITEHFEELDSRGNEGGLRGNFEPTKLVDEQFSGLQLSSHGQPNDACLGENKGNTVTTYKDAVMSPTLPAVIVHQLSDNNEHTGLALDGSCRTYATNTPDVEIVGEKKLPKRSPRISLSLLTSSCEATKLEGPKKGRGASSRGGRGATGRRGRGRGGTIRQSPHLKDVVDTSSSNSQVQMTIGLRQSNEREQSRFLSSP